MQKRMPAGIFSFFQKSIPIDRYIDYQFSKNCRIFKRFFACFSTKLKPIEKIVWFLGFSGSLISFSEKKSKKYFFRWKPLSFQEKKTCFTVFCFFLFFVLRLFDEIETNGKDFSVLWVFCVADFISEKKNLEKKFWKKIVKFFENFFCSKFFLGGFQYFVRF